MATRQHPPHPSFLPFLLEKEPTGHPLPRGQPQAWPSCSSGANISCRKTSRERRAGAAQEISCQPHRCPGPGGLGTLQAAPNSGVLEQPPKAGSAAASPGAPRGSPGAPRWLRGRLDPRVLPRCHPWLLCSILPAQTRLPPRSHPRFPASPAARLHIIILSLESCFSGKERSSLSLNPEGED